MTSIDATWLLESPSGDVTTFRVSYTDRDVGDIGFYCFTDVPSTFESDCHQYIQLLPCKGYDVTVQPRNIDIDIGISAVGISYTLPGKFTYIKVLFHYKKYALYQVN